MDQIKIGAFISELRKEQGFTQEQLGEKIGVTNKTVSRWETGVYLPPAEMLLALSRLFNVSINDILSGKRLSDNEYKKAAEENLSQAIKSSFSQKEKLDFYKKKWLKDHVSIMIVIGIIILAVFVTGFILRESLIGSAAVLLTVMAHGWRNSAMMSYAENKTYGAPKEDK